MWLNNLHCHKIQVQVGSWQRTHHSPWHCICILFTVHFSDLCCSTFYTAIKYKFKQVVGRRLIVLLGTVFCILFTGVYIFQTYVSMWLTDLDCRKIQVQAGSWQRTYCTSSVLGAVFCTSFRVNSSVRHSST